MHAWTTAIVSLLGLLVAATAAAGTITRQSVGTGGVEGRGGEALVIVGSLSADARVIVFTSDHPNLVAGDTNGTYDVFVRDRATVTTVRVSVSPTGDEANGVSVARTISADGRFVLFQSDASNLVPDDTNRGRDVFIYDRETGALSRASLADDGSQGRGSSYAGGISADGRFVVFDSDAANLVPGDINQVRDVFLRDRLAGTTTRVSGAHDGTETDGFSYLGLLSDDGRTVAFVSAATNVIPEDTNEARDVFVYNREEGTTSRVSVASDGAEAHGQNGVTAVSRDGRFVVFDSTASDLAPGDANGTLDVFVHDRATGATTWITPERRPMFARGFALGGSISADGRFVTFYGSGDFLGFAGRDTNQKHDAFRHDRVLGTTIRTSTPPWPAETANDSLVTALTRNLSADGRALLFVSDSPDFVAGDTNGTNDLFLWESSCGNAFLDADEACDDGNFADGDGCDRACQPDAAGPTTTTTSTTVATTTTRPRTTTTTLPPVGPPGCEVLRGFARVRCVFERDRSPAVCTGVILPRPVVKHLARTHAALVAAESAAGRRLKRAPTAIARAFRKACGAIRKAERRALPAGCAAALRTLVCTTPRVLVAP